LEQTCHLLAVPRAQQAPPVWLAHQARPAPPALRGLPALRALQDHQVPLVQLVLTERLAPLGHRAHPEEQGIQVRRDLLDLLGHKETKAVLEVLLVRPAPRALMARTDLVAHREVTVPKVRKAPRVLKALQVQKALQVRKAPQVESGKLQYEVGGSFRTVGTGTKTRGRICD